MSAARPLNGSQGTEAQGVTPEELAQRLQEALDEGVITQIYKAASVRPEEILTEMQLAGLEATTIDGLLTQPTEELDPFADKVLSDVRRTGAIAGATYGAGGVLTALPEVVHLMVLIMRTAQRLSLVYGQEIQSFRGRMRLWETMGEALGVDPEILATASAELAQDLPVPFFQRPGLPVDPVTIRVAQKVLITVAIPLISKRWARLVPVLGIGVSTLGNYVLLQRLGSDLKAAYRGRHQLLAARRAGSSQRVEFQLDH